MSVKIIRTGNGPALIRARPATRMPMRLPWGKIILVLLGIALAMIVAHPAFAQAAPAVAPPVTAPVTHGAGDAVDHALGDLGGGKAPLALSLQVLIIMGLLTILPGILLMMTSFTRIIIVLGFVRNALGTPSMPPNQVLVGIALFLSLFVMAPTFTQINDTALQPLMDKKIDEGQALKRAEAPIRDFMFKQVDQRDLALFTELSKSKRPKTRADVPTQVLIPAFVLSEIKTAFEIGFLILIPFLIIDMVIASTVMSMGMVMLPPVVISLPFKILLFVLVDGWHLVSESLIRGFAQ